MLVFGSFGLLEISKENNFDKNIPVRSYIPV